MDRIKAILSAIIFVSVTFNVLLWVDSHKVLREKDENPPQVFLEETIEFTTEATLAETIVEAVAPVIPISYANGIVEGMPDFDTMPFSDVRDMTLVNGIEVLVREPASKLFPYPMPVMYKSSLHNRKNLEEFCNRMPEILPLPDLLYIKDLPRIKYLFCINNTLTSLLQPCQEYDYVARFKNGWIHDESHVGDFLTGYMFTYDHENITNNQFLRLQAWDIREPVRPNNYKGKVVKHFYRLANGIARPHPISPGHYPHEGLPYILRLIEHTPLDTKILVFKTDLTWKFLYYLIERGFVDEKRLEYAEKGVFYRADELYTSASYPGCITDANWLPSKENCQLIRKYFRTEKDPLHLRDCKNCTDIVIIHRADADMRTVQNYDEMLSALRESFPEENFVTFISAEWSDMQATVDLFRYAKLIIAPHGAGLFHLQFGTPGASVIELMYDDTKPVNPTSFYGLAVAAGIQYHTVMCSGRISGKWMQVPIPDLVSTVGEILQQQRFYYSGLY